MPKRGQGKDIYPNRAVERVTMGAANAITFRQIRFGTGIFAGVALILHRVEFSPGIATLVELVATTDEVRLALTNRDDLTDLEPTNLNVLMQYKINVIIVGSVVGILHQTSPHVIDLSTMPGGGMIIPTNPLYLGMDSVGLVAAGVCDLSLYYTFKKLTDADYIELVQGMLPANI